jgi:DNA modification methylase
LHAESCGGGLLVADFFSGSGTTAVACHNLGIDFIAVEKDEEYFKKSVERLKEAQAQMRLFTEF